MTPQSVYWSYQQSLGSLDLHFAFAVLPRKNPQFKGISSRLRACFGRLSAWYG